MDFDNLYFENTEEEEEEGANLPGKYIFLVLNQHLGLELKPFCLILISYFASDVSKSEAGISPVTGLVRGGGRRGPDIDWREIARFFSLFLVKLSPGFHIFSSSYRQAFHFFSSD